MVRLATRGVLLSLSLLTILTIFVGVYQYRGIKESLYLREELESMAVIMIQKHLDLVNHPVSGYLQDISLWNETVSFMENRSRNFSFENIDLSGQIFNIDETWVYTPLFKKFYYFKNKKSTSPLVDLDPVLPLIINRFSSERLFSFFYAKGDSIFKITCSSIHPSTDAQRKTKPSGYIIACILYDNRLFDSLKAELPMLHDIKIISGHPEIYNNPEMLSVVIPLADINGTRAGAIHAQFVSAFTDNIRDADRQQRIFLYIVIAGLLVLTLALRHSVIRPVKEIYKLLFMTGYSPEPSQIKNMSFEFTRIMELINLNKTVEIKLGEALKEAEQQKAIAEKATKEKSDFLASMSHEIRTPLTGVLGLSDMLLETGLNPEQQEISDCIRISAHATLAIINDILDLSKIEAGKLLIVNEAFNISRLLEDVTLIIKGYATGRELDIILENSIEQSLTVEGDSKRLSQILLNLGGNAIKYTVKGEIRITACSMPLSADEMDFSFIVKDPGIGMNEEQLGRIFDKYEQVHDPAAFTGGTGLGLAITKSLINLMNGKLEVSSIAGSGSTFTVRLKMKCFREKIFKSSQDVVNSLDLDVLIAEDNLINSRVIENIINKTGCTCTLCNNGRQAVDLAETNKYDLILMDFNMPVLDGMEAAGIIRSGTGPNRTTPIYAISADLPEYAAEKSVQSGMNGYIMKPFVIKDVHNVLKNIKNSGNSRAI